MDKLHDFNFSLVQSSYIFKGGAYLALLRDHRGFCFADRENVSSATHSSTSHSSSHAHTAHVSHHQQPNSNNQKGRSKSHQLLHNGALRIVSDGNKVTGLDAHFLLGVFKSLFKRVHVADCEVEALACAICHCRTCRRLSWGSLPICGLHDALGKPSLHVHVDGLSLTNHYLFYLAFLQPLTEDLPVDLLITTRACCVHHVQESRKTEGEINELASIRLGHRATWLVATTTTTRALGFLVSVHKNPQSRVRFRLVLILGLKIFPLTRLDPSRAFLRSF
mmetsp:Transcript_47096/g.121698  ORF Transcript_47096/g.121698 Transcript_47096/m.121698 type:complete len:278 (-) Transcript_47096:318-1151(-)